MADPLVHPKWAAVLGAVGLSLAVYTQLAPPDLQLVPAAMVPGLGLLATGTHAWAESAHQPLLHVLATTLAVVAGTAEQPTVKVGGGA